MIGAKETSITKAEVQEMIDDAIRKHNRNASVISMCVGWVVLALFAEGMIRLVGTALDLIKGITGCTTGNGSRIICCRWYQTGCKEGYIFWI